MNDDVRCWIVWGNAYLDRLVAPGDIQTAQESPRRQNFLAKHGPTPLSSVAVIMYLFFRAEILKKEKDAFF